MTNSSVKTEGSPMALRSEEVDASMKEVFRQHLAERDRRFAERPAIEKAGVEALKRLWPVARGDTGQSRVIARFLLGCYNGRRFPFDLTDFRLLDFTLFDGVVSENGK
jgi:hypothetical protein